MVVFRVADLRSVIEDRGEQARAMVPDRRATLGDVGDEHDVAIRAPQAQGCNLHEDAFEIPPGEAREVVPGAGRGVLEHFIGRVHVQVRHDARAVLDDSPAGLHIHHFLASPTKDGLFLLFGRRCFAHVSCMNSAHL
jgi:hypothetical protein